MLLRFWWKIEGNWWLSRPRRRLEDDSEIDLKVNRLRRRELDWFGWAQGRAADCNEYRLHKMQGVSSKAEELLGAQEVRCSMDFFISARFSVHTNGNDWNKFWDSWFQTFAVFWMLYSFFSVIPRRCVPTFRTHFHLRYTTYENGTRVFRNAGT